MSRYTVITAKDSKRYFELSAGMERASRPVFLDHDPAVDKYWPILDETFPDNQFCFLDRDSGRAAAVGNSIPLAFNGDWSDLPHEGIDWVLEKAFQDHADGKAPTIVSALYIEIASTHRGQRLSSQVLAQMRHIALSQGFKYMVAPIRPSMKSYYPLIPIEEYVHWKKPDGMPFDPWQRVHVKAGGEVLHICQRAMSARGTREQWAEWTGLDFPGNGQYVVEHGLVPVSVQEGVGDYAEPGVWILHTLK